MNGRRNKQYSENIRQFAIALYYYSPAAYRYLRSVFHNNLPDCQTIRAWLKSIDGSPGITNEALQSLERKAKEYHEKGEELLIALISDEMSIRKNVAWHEKKQKFSGFATCCNENNELVPVAKDALVFMAVGEDFKLPVAYFLLAGLNAMGRAALTQLVVKSVNDTGCRVVSLTQDGLAANKAMARELGADFKDNKPYFLSPTNPNHRIYFIWDAPHMMKLGRACLKYHQLYHNGKKISWKFIEELHEMQTQRNINLGNKLTSMHCDFHVKPMNVRLACETLSNSVADCIDQLRRDGYTQFQNSQETTEYIRIFNNIMDIFNYKPKMAKDGNNFKKSLCPATANDIFSYSEHVKEYLESLEIDVEITRRLKDETRSKPTKIVRKLAINSSNSTPFFGFTQNIEALKGLYTDHILNGPLTFLNTFQLSQDHLETWFSCVRRGLGKLNLTLFISV